MLYFKKEQFRKAIESYDFALAINEGYSSAVFNKANALANLGEYEEAINVYRECIELEPENVLAHCYLGESLEKLERYREAIDWYEKAGSIDPSFSESWYGIAVCYLFLKLYSDALFYAKKAISLDKENPDLWFTLGNIHTHLGEYKDAAGAYLKVTEFDPYDDEAWINLAHLEFSRGNTEKAAGILEGSYSHTFDVPNINFHLAAYNHLMGDAEQAMKFFEKGLKLDYEEHRCVAKISPTMPEEPAVISLLEKYLPSRNPGSKK
jgi:tetratricopeptide (TPR) repeat protein